MEEQRATASQHAPEAYSVSHKSTFTIGAGCRCKDRKERLMERNRKSKEGIKCRTALQTSRKRRAIRCETYAHYEQVRALISEGVLQGLSKEGWSTRGKAYWTKEGDFDYYLVEEMEMLAVSLVTTPANGNPLEKAKEIRNTLQFVKHEDNAEDARDAFEAMFN